MHLPTEQITSAVCWVAVVDTSGILRYSLEKASKVRDAVKDGDLVKMIDEFEETARRATSKFSRIPEHKAKLEWGSYPLKFMALM
jgi:hypothetical protein